jgi:hypothetical protein
MEAKMIYHIYRENIAKAVEIFAHYEKYNACIAVDSLDKEMNDVFNKIALDYAKFMMLVNNRLELDSPEGLSTSLVGSIKDNGLAERRSFQLNRLVKFMDINEKLILKIFAVIDFKCVDNEADRLQRSLNKATQLINRMEMLIMNSQQIYQQKLKIPA